MARPPLPLTKVKKLSLYQRVKRKFPKATKFKCLDCGCPAVEYDHPKGFGVNGEFWRIIEPVCRSCHWYREKARGTNPRYYRQHIGPKLQDGSFYSSLPSLAK